MRNEGFYKRYEFLRCESERSKNVTALSFATRRSLILAETVPICSNHDENYYRWQQMLDGKYSKTSFNGASTICGFVSMVIKQYFCRC